MASVASGQRTVLVLGVSQHGKSKTIAALLEGQGIVEDVPVVGEGISSETKAPALHCAHRAGEATRLRTANPWDPVAALGADDPYPQLTRAIADASAEGPELVGDCDAQMARHSRRVWDSFQHDGSYKAELGFGGPLLPTDGPEGCELQLRFLDTPGLEATDGKDDESMAQVLEALVQSSVEVACVLLVAQVGAPFSGTWVKQVRRYWLQFPPLRTHWVVVHTRAEPLGARSCEWAKQDSCFERDCFVRVRALKAHLREFMGDDADVVRHVFMEHCTPGASEFRVALGHEAIRHFQVQTQNLLMRHIADFAPVPLGELPYRKSEGMERVDEKMLEWLRGREAVAQQHEAFCAKQLMAHMKNKDGRQRQLSSREEEMSALRQERLTTFQHFKAEPKHNFNPFRREVYTQRVGVHYPTVEAETTKLKWWHASCKREVVWIPEVGEWEIRITAPPLRAVRQEVKLLTNSVDKHQQEIERMSKERTDLELQVAEADGQRLVVEASLREVGEQLRHFGEMQDSIKQDMSLVEYGRTRDFYVQAQRGVWSGEECCRRFAAVQTVPLPLGLYKVVVN